MYQRFFGSPLPKDKSVPVINITNLSYVSAEAFYDGVKLTGVDAILPFKSGVVVFVGEKENYGTTIIIQGMDGIDYWYANVTDIAVKLYDYIASDQAIASAKDNILYLVFKKADEVLDFEEYI
jgi:murein DD-endopeptidase MepM/ murein hydrolase activator NlpD